MLIAERLVKITKMIEEQHSVSIDYLAQTLKVSKDTIRRDLIKLENQQVIRRTHGGAILASREALIFDYNQRSSVQQKVKEQLAQEVADLIKPNQRVIFDSSTTIEEVIPLMIGKNVQPITNSLTHAMLFSKQPNVDVTVLGGKLHNDQLFLYGEETIEKLAQFTADITLLGIFAISPEGVFIHTEEEGFVKREMVKRGSKVIAVADHTKIDTVGFFKICDLHQIDVLVTDQQPANNFEQALKENNVELIVTKKNK